MPPFDFIVDINDVGKEVSNQSTDSVVAFLRRPTDYSEVE